MSEESRVILNVWRFDPDRDKVPRYQDYSVPWSDGLTLLEAVRYIYEELDQSLYFRNYHCSRGVCESCLMKIDGKTQRSCHFLLQERSRYKVEPAERYPIVRDLVVDFGVPVRLQPEAEIRWRRDGTAIEATVLSVAEPEIH